MTGFFVFINNYALQLRLYGMQRNKWKKAYDIKCEKLLGMATQTAIFRLERMWLFELLKGKGYGNCYHCGFPIESSEDMSTEHVEPWGGNMARGVCPDVKKFWDINNLRISHRRCNTSAAKGGTGVYKYIGVHPVNDKRRGDKGKYARASICVHGEEITLGNYSTPEEAAIAYDIALMVKVKGIGKLNFPFLRDDYERELKNYNTDSPAFWKIRGGPIKKQLVKYFYNKVAQRDILEKIVEVQKSVLSKDGWNE